MTESEAIRFKSLCDAVVMARVEELDLCFDFENRASAVLLLKLLRSRSNFKLITKS